MKTLWNKLLALGVITTFEEIDIKHIKLLNALTLFSGLFCLSYFAIETPYYPITQWLIVCLAITTTLFFSVLWFNYRSHYLTARLLFNITGILHIGIHILALGLQTNAQFFLLFVIMTAFFIYPKSERIYQYTIVALSAAVFIFSEIYFYYPNQPLLSVPDSLLVLFEISFDLGILVFLVGFSHSISSHYEQAEHLLALEKQYSDTLLHNILPKSIVKRLKKDPIIIADRFEATTILFADIVGFTKLSEKTPPAELVNLLNQMFSIFDELSERYGLEKIKTMGDAYMVAGGLPVASTSHAQAIADLALEMRLRLKQFNLEQHLEFNIRIGIHTGTVIAGVIGIKKFVYDIWGDTVNVASRMESHGIPGQIQVSDATYQILKDQYDFTERGVIEVKGKGEMRVYLLQGKKSG